VNEREAITRMKKGDIDGLAALVEQHQHAALRTAVLITRDTALAEDVVQGAFLRAYEKIEQFDESRPFAPWFLRSVANGALQALRKRSKELSLDFSSNGEASLGDLLRSGVGEPAQSFEAAEEKSAVREALDELSPEQRTTVVMFYYLGMTEREIADEMKRPIGTVKWRLHNARNRLRGLLQSQVDAKEANDG